MAGPSNRDNTAILNNIASMLDLHTLHQAGIISKNVKFIWKKSKVIHLGLNILVHEDNKIFLVSHNKNKTYFVLTM